MKIEIIPVAFGLNSLNLIFVMNENNKLDPIEDSIKELGSHKVTINLGEDLSATIKVKVDEESE